MTTASVINVMTASGGSGGTTIAVNLANELRLACGEAVLVVDLDLHYGAVSAFLGLAPERSLADVLGPDGDITAVRLTSSACEYLDDLHVLASPAGVDFSDPAPLQLDRIGELVEACRGKYAHTVIDAPRASRDLAATLAGASDLTLVVFELTVTDLRCARGLMKALAARDVPMDRVVPVANRFDRRARMLTLADASDALGGIEIRSIANDFEGVVRSHNYGRPLAAVSPRSPVRKDLNELAELAGAMQP